MPIPEVEQEPSTSNVRLLNVEEALVPVEATSKIRVAPAYFARSFSTASPLVTLRCGALKALNNAASSLPNHIHLLVWDGLRTVATQLEIAHRYAAELSAQVSDPVERDSLIRQYVSPVPLSEEAFLASPPPHTTGGAVDVTLCDVDGVPLDLGADFDEFNEKAWLRHYEMATLEHTLTPIERDRRYLRRILYWAMIDARFAPYPWEFWHYEFRTRRAAAFRGQETASYGAAVDWQHHAEGISA